jgi:hypothetical protein
MLNKVQRIAENPLIAAQLEENETLALEQLEQNGQFEELARKKDVLKMIFLNV